MIRIRDIDHIVLRIRDAEIALAFYRDVLGCALEIRVGSGGHRRILGCSTAVSPIAASVRRRMLVRLLALDAPDLGAGPG
jgi:hypothetical protein